jgi:hypothetical protein
MNFTKRRITTLILTFSTAAILFASCRAKKPVVTEEPPVVEQSRLQ